MKFKVCDTHFPAAWVGVKGLNLLRLDSRYYSPQYLEDDELLNSENFDKKTIGQMAALVKDGPGGWAFKANEYTTEGVPVIRASDLVNGLDLSNAVYMTDEKHQELKQSECLPGDLVISVRGTPGRAAIVPDSVKKANLNAAVVRVRLKEKWAVSGHYIASYLNSQFGKRVTQRIANGAVQNNINLTEVRSIPVPVPERHIREYICNKSIISDKCKESAHLLREDAYEKLIKLWGWSKVEKQIQEASNKKAHIIQSLQISNRLDSEFYQPKYTCLDTWLSGKDCWTLSDLIENPSKGVQPIYDSNGRIPALTVTHIDPFLIIRDGSLGFVADSWFFGMERAQIRHGEILFTVTGPPLGETVTVEDFHIPALINSHIVKFYPKKKFPYPNFITALLNSELGTALTTRFSKGIRQKELYPVDLLSFRFPKIEKDTVVLLEKTFRKSCLLIQKADEIKSETMNEIHSLIEGRFDSETILSGKLKAPTWEDIEKELEGI